MRGQRFVRRNRKRERGDTGDRLEFRVGRQRSALPSAPFAPPNSLRHDLRSRTLRFHSPLPPPLSPRGSLPLASLSPSVSVKRSSQHTRVLSHDSLPNLLAVPEPKSLALSARVCLAGTPREAGRECVPNSVSGSPSVDESRPENGSPKNRSRELTAHGRFLRRISSLLLRFLRPLFMSDAI